MRGALLGSGFGSNVAANHPGLTIGKVWVNRTKDQIKSALEYDDTLTADSTCRSEIGDYYGPGGSGHRNWDDTT